MINDGNNECINRESDATTMSQEHTPSLRSHSHSPDTSKLTMNSTSKGKEYKKCNEKDSLRIMMLGKTGVGKSSTINSLLNDNNASLVGALTSNATCAVIPFNRSVWGFRLVLVDTPGLLEKDMVSETSLRKIKTYLSLPENCIDVVMYCDRVDIYRFEPVDRKVAGAVSKHLGKHIWHHTLLVFTRAGTANTTNGLKYDEFVEGRVEITLRALREAGSPRTLPFALVENSSIGDIVGAKRILPNGIAWLPDLLNKAVLLAESKPLPVRYEPNQENHADPNLRRKWSIPLFIIAHYFLKVYLFDNLVSVNIT